MAAEAYARQTGRLGVCLVTSGPGATNLLTGLWDANVDRSSVVALTSRMFFIAWLICAMPSAC